MVADQWLSQLELLINTLSHLNLAYADETLYCDRLKLQQQQRNTAEATLSLIKIPEMREIAVTLLMRTVNDLDESLNMGNLYYTDLDWLTEELNYITPSKEDFASEKDHLAYLILLRNLLEKAIKCKKSPKLFYCPLDEELATPITDLAAIYFVHCLIRSHTCTPVSPYYVQSLSYLKKHLNKVIHDVSLPQKTFGRIYALHKLKRFVQVVRYTLRDCTVEETVGMSFEEPIKITILQEEVVATLLQKYRNLLEVLRRLNLAISELL